MKKFLKIAAAVLILAVVGALVAGYIYVKPIAAIGTGYAAKILCSSVYVSGRTYEAVMSEDLEMAGDYYISAGLDEKHQAAEASLLGIFTTRAVFRPGLGCTLCVDGANETELRQQALGISGADTAVSDEIWPDGERVAAVAPAGVDRQKLEAALDRAFEETPPGQRRTRAVVVVYDGRIVAERYASGFTKDTPLLGWSMTKSVTNALIGILVRQGNFDLKAGAPVAEWQNADDPRKEITLDQLMHMSSGLTFVEEYEDNLKSDVNTMLFTKYSAAGYAAAKPLAFSPGTKWSYSSGTTNIIARIAREASGLSQAEWFRFPRRELFDRIGMHSAVIEPDPSGDFVGSSYMYATARDWARFGLLYLNDGLWQGERILPEDWVKYSTTPTPLAPPGEAYGAQFWLNAANPQQWLGFLPADMYLASGHEGQTVMVIPSYKMVVVRLGLTRGPTAEAYLGFVADVLKALPQG
jgi:CubicO group peptidase (beta-lactamase class C family)